MLALSLAAQSAGARDDAPEYTATDIHQAQTILEDMQKAVTLNYYPEDRIGKDFDARCAAAERTLESVHSNSEAFGVIADALASPDARIRFIPPLRSSRVDYSWQWQLIGDAAYVTQVDREGDARKQGLAVGDKIASIEGVTISRENYESIYYVFHRLAPRPGLRVLVESRGQEPRWLAIASTVRPQRKLTSSGSRTSFWAAWELSESDRRHRDEFLDLKQHLHRSGSVAIWRAIELEHDSSAVADGLKELKSANALILDLRGVHVRQHDPVLRLLDDLFVDKFTAGTVKRGIRSLTDLQMRIGSGSGAFQGTVLVLVDAETGAYAEVLARVIQQRQRGVIIGDFTLGRVLEETQFYQTRGTAFSFATASALIPTGAVVMADGVELDGKGVTPDLLLRPTAADLAGGRDVMLAKALAMLKQKVVPEDARKIVRLPSEDDDDNE